MEQKIQISQNVASAERNLSLSSCQIPNCDRPYNARGYCKKHYDAWRKWGDDFEKIQDRGYPSICNVEDCIERHFGLGYCRRHYRAFKKYGDPQIRKQAFAGEGTIIDGYRVFQID